MSILFCSAENCVNYVNGVCTARDIKVKGKDATAKAETMCDTFEEKGVGSAIKSAFNTNYVGAIKQAMSGSDLNISPDIHCGATKCTYNYSHKCLAQSVQIYGPVASTSQGTQCQTFTKR